MWMGCFSDKMCCRKKPESDATKAEWKNWGPNEDGWVEAGWGNKQRVTQYAKTNLQAHSAGISAAVSPSSNNMRYPGHY